MRPKLLPRAAIAVFAAATLAFGSVAVPTAQADTRLAVPGAGPLYYPTFITELPVGQFYFFGTGEGGGTPLSVLEGYDALNHMIGKNWFPGTTAQVVNYPASLGILSGNFAAPGTNEAVETGRASLDEQIKAATVAGDPVVIAGLSEGTIVINRELAHLATDPEAPLADQLSFALFSSPELGLAAIYLPLGVTVPLFDFTVSDLADSQYDVDVVFHQYDAWADPPDRPWKLLSVVNTLFGLLYYHNKPAFAAPSDAVEVSSATSELGGTTTTYMIPSPTLPLLKPLQQLGAPTEFVERLNSALKPRVDAGYSRLTPDAGPYFSHGRLVKSAEEDNTSVSDDDSEDSRQSSAEEPDEELGAHAVTDAATTERDDDAASGVQSTADTGADRDDRSSEAGDDDDSQSTTSSPGGTEAGDAA
jgi:hypothetical protein